MQDEWQPIETAPRDGTLVIIYIPRTRRSDGLPPIPPRSITCQWQSLEFVERKKKRGARMPSDKALEVARREGGYWGGHKPINGNPLDAPPRPTPGD